MPGRKYQAGGSSYRYSINGQEKESELNENITTALFWEYDSRIARRWNVDPKENTSISPYNCFAANPIWYTDILGDTIINGQTMEGANSASATTLNEVVHSTKAKKIPTPDPGTVLRTNTNIKCHITNAEVTIASSIRYYKAAAAANNGKGLDVKNGQLFLPINPFLNFISGGRVYVGPSPYPGVMDIGTGFDVNADGYVSRGPRPYGGNLPFVSMKGLPVPGATVLRNMTYTSESVAKAAKQLANGMKSVTVASQAEAEELFLTQYVTKGFKNTTDFTPFEMKDKFLFPYGKANTYHWDLFDTQHGGVPHLQIHDEIGNIIRVFFPK